MGNEEFNAEFEGGSTNEELFNVEFDEMTNIGGGAVNSVNGQTGDVVLITSDLENTSDYQTGSEVESAISTAVAGEASARESAISAEATAREAADINLQSQIDGITASSDVTDIVGTYAHLQAYDTSTLGDNDIIKVLQDESRNDETTYYRWSTATQSFTLIGEEGPYYTKSQTDTLLGTKQNTLTAGDGIDITNDVISATGGSGIIELTSADYNWPESSPDGVAIWTLDSGVYVSKDGVRLYKSNNDSALGTDASMVVMQHENAYPSAILYNWGGVQGFKTGGIVLGYSNNAGTLVAETLNNKIVTEASRPLVQTTGTSITDVMSQNAVTRMVFTDPSSTTTGIAIGAESPQATTRAIAVGNSARANATLSIALGYYARITNPAHANSVALGPGAVTTGSGQLSLQKVSSGYGYNNTIYSLLTGVHDPVDDHDAANKEYVDTLIAALEARIAALEGN